MHRLRMNSGNMQFWHTNTDKPRMHNLSNTLSNKNTTSTNICDKCNKVYAVVE